LKISSSFGVESVSPNPIDAGDVDRPDAIARTQVVHDLGIHGVQHRHAADADIVGEQVQKASPRGHDPGPTAIRERSLDSSARPGESKRRASVDAVSAAFALCDLQHAGCAVRVRRGIAPGNERHIADHRGVENADRSSGRREIREGVDVRDFDVVDDEQVLEGASATDDDVVAEVVRSDHHARHGLHVARHVLQRPGGAEDLLRAEQVD
jgi:hypothetical protein